MGIDLEHPLREYQKENPRPNLDVNNGISGNEECDKEGPTSPEVIKVTDGLNLNCLQKIEPRDGMDFESKEEAFSFYKEYAKSVGFAVVIKASRRSRVSGKFIDAKFSCTKYGSKRESCSSDVVIPVKKKRGRINRSWEKTDCKACMHVKRLQDGRWLVHNFVKEHNHENIPWDQSYYFHNADVNTRARTKKLHVKKSEKHKDVNNNQLCSSTRDLNREEGDAQDLLAHFVSMQDENPYSFYAIDLKEEQLLRNVLWVDPKGRLEYEYFKDVVLFDTTYIKNGYKLSFAPFFGVNHHFQLLFLGCGLLADETKSTYVWLMRSWLRAMRGNAPNVILTVQDEPLKEAIKEVFPNSLHCFCLWHIFSEIQERLGYVIRQHENFMTKFNKCVFKSWTTDQFEKRWLKIAERFNLSNDKWFQSMYEDRNRWVPTYMRDVFFAGMNMAQRSESISCFLDKYMQRKTTFKEFLEHYKTIQREKYEEEARAGFESLHKQPGLKSPSPFGKQMSMLYTHAIFKKFQEEVLGVVACHPRKESEVGSIIIYRVQDFEQNQDFIVEWNEKTQDISCLCHSFEFYGYLCRHVMIVLQVSGINNIPSQYILKRWTKNAKSRQEMRQELKGESRSQRYNDLCWEALKLSDEASLSQESYDIVVNALEEALRKCQKKHSASKKRVVNFEPEVITIGMHESWQQMGHSNTQVVAVDCSYESEEGMQGMEQLNSRAPILDSCFCARQNVQGMGQLNSTASSPIDYFTNQHSVQGLGQLNSIAPTHDADFITQSQRMHGTGQLNVRPQPIPGCFDLHYRLQELGQDLELDQSNVGSTQLSGISSKRLQPKDLSH